MGELRTGNLKRNLATLHVESAGIRQRVVAYRRSGPDEIRKGEKDRGLRPTLTLVKHEVCCVLVTATFLVPPLEILISVHYFLTNFNTGNNATSSNMRSRNALMAIKCLELANSSIVRFRLERTAQSLLSGEY